MTGPPPALRGLAERHLGSCRLVALPGGDRPGQRVARFRAADGREYIAKQHLAAEKHRREVHAYRRWAPALGANAPQLLAADQATMTVLITALPGQPVDGAGDVPSHRQAGVLLRSFHDAEPLWPLDGFQYWLASHISRWREQCLPLLSARERQVIDQHLATLHGLGAPLGGPCHLDYQPRNWVTDHAGTLGVIDSSTPGSTCRPATWYGSTSAAGHHILACVTHSWTATGARSPTKKTSGSDAAARSTCSPPWSVARRPTTRR